MGGRGWSRGVYSSRFPARLLLLLCDVRQIGTVPSCYGSASVQCGGTKAIASVQAELNDAGAEGPGASIEVSVTCSNLPGSAARQGEDLSAALSSDANRMFANPIPSLLQSLMVSDRHAWRLLVDVMLVEYDGSLLDVISIAVWAALSDTKLPTVCWWWRTACRGLTFGASSPPSPTPTEVWGWSCRWRGKRRARACSI
eukprot:761891-Hanusia_phi.AAC.2